MGPIPFGCMQQLCSLAADGWREPYGVEKLGPSRKIGKGYSNSPVIFMLISDENLKFMPERLMETIIWPSEDTNAGGIITDRL
ncbi:hypothetical protein IEQ34_006828 [Dendrobium chrysotoxum]|uniref:Uncharacterized protein n=1 Tax=Dendrobium chrysotoxum TaxID=161865 RepID=A0AAV7H847_DENCH|nr:hypothetical protein IEQ34_006828 [Dendrobium chrysotoxum]